MSKGFKEAAAAARPVYHTIIGSAQPGGAVTSDVYHTQDTQEVHEAQPAQNTQGAYELQGTQTQGRRGHKLPRINMAFSEENLDYLRIMAGIQGQSITKYVNTLVEKDRQHKAELYEAAKKLAGRQEDGGENPA